MPLHAVLYMLPRDFICARSWFACKEEIVGGCSSMGRLLKHVFTLPYCVSHGLINLAVDILMGNFFAEEFLTSQGYMQKSECDSSSDVLSINHCALYTHLVPYEELQEEQLTAENLLFAPGNFRYHDFSYLPEGLMLPLFTFNSAFRMGLAPWRFLFRNINCTKSCVKSLIQRCQKTFRGSSDDIGWLEATPGLPPMEDGTKRFLEIVQHIRNGEHKLPDSFVYLLIPGLFSNHSPLYFIETKKFFSKMGLACHIAKIHSESSVEKNASEIKQYIEEIYWGSGKRLMLLGHSKGGVDAAAALSIYFKDLEDKVAGLVLVQSPYGGTPLASDILREGQIADKEIRRLMEFAICKLIKGDLRALDDLTYEKRKEFIASHKLPAHIPLVSFVSEASISPIVLASMSYIAHTELPWLPLLRFSREADDIVQTGIKVPIVIPVSAVMALCALHLQIRYGEKSDGLVTCRDAQVPGSVVVRPNRKLDHSWMVFSSWRKDTTEPTSWEMCEALFTLLMEIGKLREKDDGESSTMKIL